MGFADMLIKLGIRYDSEEALKLGEKVMKFVTQAGREMSVELGKERGNFPNFKGSIWDKKGYKHMRNATVTTIAPTGTISIISDCSSGIEPLFAVAFVRKNVLGGEEELVEVNKLFEKYAKEKGIIKPVYPANNALGFFGEGPKEFLEKCQGCGECEVGLTAGICPLTQCPKGLLNSPCGGTRPNGKCEVDPEKDCAWVLIYERLKNLGKLSLLKKIHPPHNWEKALRPRKLEVEPIDLLEKLKETKKVIQSLGI